MVTPVRIHELPSARISEFGSLLDDPTSVDVTFVVNNEPLSPEGALDLLRHHLSRRGLERSRELMQHCLRFNVYCRCLVCMMTTCVWVCGYGSVVMFVVVGE